MGLDEWAKRWGIPAEAIDDLRATFGVAHDGKHKGNDSSESRIQSLVRLEASAKGFRLWRNNVGATYTKEGAFIRYGLANESQGVNTVIKSADLIGIKPVRITTAHVGCVIGQFVSREVKAGNWRYTGSAREQAQLKWAELIISLGGDACFCNSEGTL
jgi:hypothetical protein